LSDNVLVIQLTRIGDIAQSGAFFQALRQKLGNVCIDILCDAKNVALLNNTGWFNNVIGIDVNSVAISSNVIELLKTLIRLKEKDYCEIYNLNSSKIAGILASYLAKCPDCIKGHRYDLGAGNIISNKWWSLIKAFGYQRKAFPVNIVEAFRYTLMDGGGVVSPHFPIVKPNGIQKGSMGIVVGSGSPKRYWPSVYFVELISRLLDEGYGPLYLIGSQKEQAYGRYISKQVDSNSLINMVGKTNLVELCELLSSLDLVIGADTGPVHLAAGMGIKTLSFFFGPAWALETGPFGQGQMVIQSLYPCAPCKEETKCMEAKCRAYITPDLVFKVTKMSLEGSRNIIFNEKDCMVLEGDKNKCSYSYEVRYLDPRAGIDGSLTMSKLYRSIIAYIFNLPISGGTIVLSNKHANELFSIANLFAVCKLPKSYSEISNPFVSWLLTLDGKFDEYIRKISDAIFFVLGEING